MKKYLQLLIALQIVQSLFESLNNQYSSTDEDWEQQIRMLRRVDRARYHINEHLKKAKEGLKFHQLSALDALEKSLYNFTPEEVTVLVRVAMGTATEVRDACGELKKNGQLAPLVVVNRGQELVTARIDHGHGATMEADNILPGPGQVSLRGKTWDTSPEGWYPRYTIYS